jgi:glycosyltransferase involved in cell wall biosynthesis
MHILIFDPLHKGHHLNWVRLLADAAAPFAQKITFATAAQVPGSPEFAEHLKQMPAHFSVDDSLGPIEITGRRFEGMILARRAWAGLQDAVRRHRPDHVYVPHSDLLHLAGSIPLLSSMKPAIDPSRVDAIVLGAPFAYRGLPFRQRRKAQSQFRGLRRLPFGRLLFIDPIAHEWIEKNHPSVARRSQLLPDPVTPVGTHEKAAARAELGLPANGRWISSVGVLDSRKGVDDLVAAFAAATLAPGDRLLLAGRATDSVRAAVAAAEAGLGPGRIFLLDRLLTNREIELAVSAADIVAVSHRFPDHIGSASILIRAIAAGRPVLASELGWPGHVTRNHSLGWIYPTEPAARPKAIAESLAAAKDFVFSPDARAFAAFHSVDGFAQILTAPLRQMEQPATAPASAPELPSSVPLEQLA